MYNVGDIFYYDEQYGSRARFCNENGFVIEEIETDEEGNRRFQICKPEMSRADILRSEIVDLKRNLTQTDYQAIKFAEGELTLEEYSAAKEQRKQWRKRINELEAQLNNI